MANRERHGLRRYTVNLPQGVAEQLERAAQDDHRTVQSMLGHLVRVGLTVTSAERSMVNLAPGKPVL